MYVIIYYDIAIVNFFFFFKQKTAYEMRISDWSSDVCSSDLGDVQKADLAHLAEFRDFFAVGRFRDLAIDLGCVAVEFEVDGCKKLFFALRQFEGVGAHGRPLRSEEHTSELQSLMRISYAVFCLKKKRKHHNYK